MKKETEETKSEEAKDHKVKMEDLNEWADSKLQELIDELDREDCAMLCFYHVGKKATYFYANRSFSNMFNLLYNAMLNDEEFRKTALAAALSIRRDDVEKIMRIIKTHEDGDAAV